MYKEEKSLWADYLRATATIAVILLHVTSPILYQYGSISNVDWWTGNILDSSVRFCVPIFLMLTGALILPKTYELGDFLKKRFSRVLLPFIFWSVVYILYNLILNWNNGVNMTATGVIAYIYNQFSNGASYHLWYIYMIIGIYLFIPVVSKWILNSTKKEIIYYLAIWFIVILMSLPWLIKIKPAIDLSYFSGFLGYPILGYLLMVEFNSKNKLYPVLLFVTGVTITVCGTYFLTKKSGELRGELYSFLSPNVLIASIGIFLFFKNSEVKNRWIRIMSKFISQYSYGIFLSHVFALTLLSEAGISWSFINPMLGIPLTTILCLVIASGITYMINKIPYGSYISG